MKDWKKELIEKWADIEHKRWSSWQKHCHKVYTRGDFDDFIPRWERQIATDYKDLSESEKESDREQVYPYIKDIERLLEEQKKEITEDIQSIIVHTTVDNTNKEFDAGATQAILNIARRVEVYINKLK